MLLAEMTIETVLTCWPKTAVLFHRYQMTACFGCQVAPFCTVDKAIDDFQVPREQFLSELQHLIDAPQENV